jgi:hypothetical protein
VGVIVGVGVCVSVAVGVRDAVAVAVGRLTGVTAPQLSMDGRSKSKHSNKIICLELCKDFRSGGVIEKPGVGYQKWRISYNGIDVQIVSFTLALRKFNL